MSPGSAVVKERPSSTQNSHSSAKPLQAHSPAKEFRLLIGVWSPFASLARRGIIRNAYNQFKKDLPVDIVFVQGDIVSSNEKNARKVRQMQYNVTRWENERFGDILHLDCEENLNEGKTYEYFKRVGTEWPDKYTHVMKTDDDTFLNIPGDFVNFGSNGSSRRSHSGQQGQEASLLGHLVQGRVEV